MRLTAGQLRRIIKEEFHSVVEQDYLIDSQLHADDTNARDNDDLPDEFWLHWDRPRPGSLGRPGRGRIEYTVIKKGMVPTASYYGKVVPAEGMTPERIQALLDRRHRVQLPSVEDVLNYYDIYVKTELSSG
jgi:hypothetical protein